jgi:hypothetical protein
VIHGKLRNIDYVDTIYEVEDGVMSQKLYFCITVYLYNFLMTIVCYKIYKIEELVSCTNMFMILLYIIYTIKYVQIKSRRSHCQRSNWWKKNLMKNTTIG